MRPPEPEPTRDEMLAMAYVDGELNAETRVELDRRMAAEPTLACLVAHYQELDLLAREMAPPEPADHEWARLELDLVQRTGVGLGWILFVLGCLGLAATSVWSVATSEMPIWSKTLTLAVIGGFGLLLSTTVRARLAVFHCDPYRKVQR